jgi:hypothetical protein
MRSRAYLFRCAALCTIGVLAGLALAGCASGQSTPPSSGLLDQLFAKTPADEPPPPPAKEACGTPAQCKSALKKMVDDPNRGWVGEQQSAAQYTSGMRHFAYRALRKKLSCRELGLALGEVRGASKSLTGTVPGVSPEQLTRTRALNTQVEAELSKEHGARCRA